jgi:serine protease Do
MGVQIQSVTEDMAKTLKMKDARGAIVSDVTADSPAEKGGLKPGDVIVSADGTPIADNGALSSYIARKTPGTVVRLSVNRDGTAKELSVTLGSFPDEVAAASEAEDDAQAQLGMSVQTLTPALAQQLELPRSAQGVVVSSVEAGEAAEEAGLQRGDLIGSVNGVAVDGVEAFLREIAAARPEGLARLRVRRGDNHSFLVLKLH